MLQEEFAKAHEHHRHGPTEYVLNEALKALESSLKATCAQPGWVHPANATSNALLLLAFDQGLIPVFCMRTLGL